MRNWLKDDKVDNVKPYRKKRGKVKFYQQDFITNRLSHHLFARLRLKLIKQVGIEKDGIRYYVNNTEYYCLCQKLNH